MSLFIRRFTSDPGTQVFLEIEAVNILDLTPPSTITGVGTGTVMLVGEFEDGLFGSPTEVTSATDLANTFGGFGYTYGGVAGLNPCARSRLADGAITPEYWNGNGMIALNGKRFARLLIARVDTSVGSVDFERCAWIGGGSSFTYPLTAGDTLLFGSATTPYTATFSATAAALTSGGGSYPTGFTGGEVMTIVRDGTTYTVVFQATDQTQAQVIARINATLGYTAAVDNGGNTTKLSSLTQGTSAAISIIAPTTASVLTQTGFTLAAATGTGNVANIAQVRPEEISAIVATASTSAFKVRQLTSGALRLSNVGQPLTGVARVTGGSAQAVLGFATTQNAAWQDVPNSISITALGAGVGTALGLSVSTSAQPVIVSSAGTYPVSLAGATMTLQVSGRAPVTVTFQASDTAQADVVNRINTTMGYTAVKVQSGTIIAIAGPGTNATTIPAGTRVRDTAANEWVTMATTTVPAASSDPIAIKVRPAVDDGSAVAAAPLAVSVLPYAINGASFVVFNPLALSAALTESQIDVRYLAALDSTLNPANVAAQTNLIYSARQSNAVREALRQNALDASANGLYGRMAVIRPPLGTTTRAMAESSAAQPGVGAYRDQRVIYAFPGVQTFVPAIANLGLTGGAGFTADGIIDIGADGFVASICSQLPPEENPGQTTSYAAAALGIEKNNPDVQTLTINDYKRFRASGICAPRVEAGTMIFQSGVTSIDPTINPSLRNIARRRMADFIQDSLAFRMKSFGKQLSTRQRRSVIAGEIRAFLNGLLSPNNPAGQRISGYEIDPNTANTPDTLALGIYRIIINVRTLASLDAIVLQTTIGEGVTISS